MKFVTKKEALGNRSERPVSSLRDVITEPITKLKIELRIGIPIDAFMQCAEKYANRAWYGETVKNGWPGVKGKVQLGVPAIDKFNEIVVVYRNENGYMKSRSLGRVPWRR